MNTSPLIVGIIAIIISLLAELGLHVSDIGWKKRKLLAGIALLSGSFGVGVFIAEEFNLFGVLILFFSLYKIANLLRMYQLKMHEEYLKKATLHCFIVLGAIQVLLLVLFALIKTTNFNPASESILFFSILIVLIVSIILFLTTLINIIKTKAKNVAFLSEDELPTVSLAIPARNENKALKECILSAISSEYPKLEILVYDDCSQDKTAEIIKSFAHDGVRFIKGEEATETWLAKNMAYQMLLDQSSGDIIMFSGVDVRFNKQTIYRLVEQFKSKKINMMSVLPKRQSSGIVSSLIQPMRYWWELALPIWLLKRPPVLSTCWLADRKSLIKLGGFKSVTRAIIPEEHFARQNYINDDYAFIRSNTNIDLDTQKDFTSQWMTAVRTRYPQAHKQPEAIAIRTLLMLIFLLAPFVAFFVAIFSVNSSDLFLVLSGCSILLLTFGHFVITLITNPTVAIFAIINLPIVVILDIVAMHISMYRYEFGEVIWKGRNISIPAMHVYPHLPKV